MRYKPKTKAELKNLLFKEKVDPTKIYTSLITDMSSLFSWSEFNGDISGWDVSNVVDMFDMFSFSEFKGDISNWDVSNVRDMKDMFFGSEFNGDISRWDVSSVDNMKFMFSRSEFEGDISKWDVSNVIYITEDVQKALFNHSPSSKELFEVKI